MLRLLTWENAWQVRRKRIRSITEQKTERRVPMLSDKTLAQLVLFAAFVGVIYFL